MQVAMTFHNCQQCGRRFEYNEEVGYSTEFCGPLCDGIHSGKRIGKSELGDALDALRQLYDVQNGPPLIKYEKDWTEAMELTKTILQKHGR